MVERHQDDAVDVTALPPSSDLAGALPESLTIAIDLPAEPEPAAPEDELAVAIDDVVVDPGVLVQPTTTSIRVPSLLSLAEAVEVVPEPDPIPPLPARPVPKRRALPGRAFQPIPDPEPTPAVEPLAEHEPLPAAVPSDQLATSDGDRPAAPDEEATEDASSKRTRKREKAPKPPKVKREPKPRPDRGPEPEGALQVALYRGTFRLVNPGDSLRVRQRKALEARIAAQLATDSAIVPVLSRKGGVGTTTVTALLGMALADVRDDRVLAVDTHPDRGTLAARVSPGGRTSVRDVVTHSGGIHSINEFAAYVVRDETRLDVVAAEAGPTLGLGFDQGDFGVLAGIAEKFYGIALTDLGGAATHSVLRAVLARAGGLVVVSGGGIDEAELASETLTWLETKGYGDLVKDAVVAINTATLSTDLRALDSIRAHFAARVRDVVIMPYDPALAAGAVIEYHELNVHTREAARDLAAAVVDGLAPEPEAPVDPEDPTD